MRIKSLRLSIALASLAMVTLSSPALAMQCEGTLTNGEIACHAVSGTCGACTFRCDDGSYLTRNVCGM